MPRQSTCGGPTYGVHSERKFVRFLRWVRESVEQVSISTILLGGLVAASSVTYALHYAQAVKSTEALTLVSGAMLGQGAAFWEGKRSKKQRRIGGIGIVCLLIVLLTWAAVWQRETKGAYKYQGQARWSGVWENPNIFGMLMGVGVVLAFGTLVFWLRRNRRTEMGGEALGIRTIKNRGSWRRWLWSAFLVWAAGVMTVGLVKSYSRGAWLGTVVGLAYLANEVAKTKSTRIKMDSRRPNKVRKRSVLRWSVLAVIAASVTILGFWNLRDTRGIVLRRIYSVGNPNDFSWRKRLTAYEGALQMMSEKPWFGFGWSQPEPVYTALYCPPKVDESMAIHCNDFLIFGTTLGIPTLTCFLAYVGMVLSAKFNVQRPTSAAQRISAVRGVGNAGAPATLGSRPRDLDCPAVCRAGAVVLLTAFCFDEALFKLASGGTFWILLQLGKIENQPTPSSAEITTSGEESRFARGILFAFGGSRFWFLLLGLLFVGTLVWAKGRDPFQRIWFRVKATNWGQTECIAVLPKITARPLPVVVYVHGSGGNLLDNAGRLRQLAEMGLAAVGIDYCQTNETVFRAQFSALLDYLGRQSWADTNHVAWVGSSLGAQRTLSFALSNVNRQPQFLVRLAGGWVPELQSKPQGLVTSTRISYRALSLNVPPPAVLLIHGEYDEVFPLVEAQNVAACLQTNGAPVELKVLSGQGHGFGENRMLVLRIVGEQCLKHLLGPDALDNYRSILSWQAQAKQVWLFWMPALTWVVLWLWCRWRTGRVDVHSANGLPTCMPVQPWWEIVLRLLAAGLATAALAQTVLHLVLPRLPVGNYTLSIARKHLVQAKRKVDFDFLAINPVWRGMPLTCLLSHLDLAAYNRELINWKIDDQVYHDFVLSPDPAIDIDYNWRRELWENFYPRIRREQGIEAAAETVARFLRERVTISSGSQLPSAVGEIWQHQIADEHGFASIYVAALRSVGIPARLDSQGRTLFWTGIAWQSAPCPLPASW